MIHSASGCAVDITAYLEEKRVLINEYLKSYFAAPLQPEALHESVTYSLFAGGKRIRPILALASYEACGGNARDILPQAAALELLHTYSLIHDDLPAMDNDDLRRGKPTNHKVFGEAIAILAGDALLTEAFFMMADTNSSLRTFPGRSMEGVRNKRLRRPSLLRLVREIARAAGMRGMVGGQAQDILAENSEPDEQTLSFIHLHKTAALIAASVRLGPMLANSSARVLRALTQYGEHMGLAFQIVDDLLDVEGTTPELGKTVGSDRAKRKLTYPAFYGVEVARRKAEECVAGALRALRPFASEADPLREIAHYLVRRRR